jgi:hypothetical protein
MSRNAPVRVVFDRPIDGQLWERAELLAGWIEGVASGRGIRVVCGGTELVVRPCPHPRGVDRGDLHGFWTELVVQRHLDAIQNGMLAIEVWREDEPLANLSLWVSPAAHELARSHPLDLADYPLPASPVPDAAPRPLVFPGLGAVGGTSLQRLARTVMLRSGQSTPIYDEASTPALWNRLRATPWAAGVRWVDGHGCYAAADGAAARITLLREPIRRLVSVYNYGLLVHPDAFAGTSFDAFVADGGARRHAQAAGLLRVAGRDPDRLGGAGALERAARAELVGAYHLVGISERFEETIFLTARLGGWDAVGMWRRVLAAPRTVDADDLAAATRRRLVDDLGPDLALYEEARAALPVRVASAGGTEWVACYRAAAARQADLPPAAKAVECLRWRQLLAEYGRQSERDQPRRGCAA